MGLHTSSKRHTTVHRDLVRPLTRLERHTSVRRIILGVFHPARHSRTPGTLRVRDVNRTAIRMFGYCGEGIKEITVVARTISDRDKLLVFLGHRDVS